jgi:hypothetical protein
MNPTKRTGIPLLILALVTLRIYFGMQVNFAHEDYVQIYLIGLEHAISGDWPYWGPDVVWSQTQLPGALQGLLVGAPLRWTGSPVAPLVLSNLISAFGLLLLFGYARKRFPDLPELFLLVVLFLIPFGLHHGSVLLNTAYLPFSGALLFIAVAELFIYREEPILPAGLSYLMLGIGLTVTYQLHLTWVMFLPFIVVLLIMSFQRVGMKKTAAQLGLLVSGAVIGAITLFPTLWAHADVLFLGTEGNLTFKPERFGRVFDLLLRYLGMATFDVTHTFNIFKSAMAESTLAVISIWAIKAVAIVQFIVIVITAFRQRTSQELKRILLLFGLTLLMALALFVLGNKHLSARTYILLFPFPVWLSLLCYRTWYEKTWFRSVLWGGLGMVVLAFLSTAMADRDSDYSFNTQGLIIESALEQGDPEVFGTRRESLMAPYQGED